VGMDLIPLAAGVDSYHFNWTGWSVILDLLRDCGAKLDAARGSNDGDIVDAMTAQSWGLLLELHLQEMVVVETPDPLIHGGHRDEIRVLEKYIEEPITHSEMMAKISRKYFTDEEPTRPAAIREMKEDDRAWVQAAADFFIRCRGFRQC
jgi:hypothetical protein